MPIPLRSDFDAPQLRVLARKTKSAPQARRLLALAAIYEGASRTEAARIGGVTLQSVRDWVVKFNAHGPEGLIDRKPPGQPSRLSDAHRAALAGILESGPIPAVHGVVRWRLVDLIQWLWDEYRLPISPNEKQGYLDAFAETPLTVKAAQALRDTQVESEEDVLVRTADATMSMLTNTVTPLSGWDCSFCWRASATAITPGQSSAALASSGKGRGGAGARVA